MGGEEDLKKTANSTGSKEGENSGANEQDKKSKVAPETDPTRPLPIVMDTLIVNMDRVMYEGRVKSLIVPVTYGSLALLPGHTPIFTKLIKGTITVNPEYGNTMNYDIDNGIAKITQFKATILVGFLDKK